MASSAEKLFAALPALAPAQLRELRARLQALEPAEGAVHGDDDAGILYNELARVCKDAGTGATPWPVLMSTSKKRYLGASKAFFLFVDQYVKPSTKTDRRRATALLANMLGHRIQRTPGRPVAVRTLVDEAYRIHDVVDDQFPGYRESGLLPVILKKSPVIPTAG